MLRMLIFAIYTYIYNNFLILYAAPFGVKNHACALASQSLYRLTLGARDSTVGTDPHLAARLAPQLCKLYAHCAPVL